MRNADKETHGRSRRTEHVESSREVPEERRPEEEILASATIEDRQPHVAVNASFEEPCRADEGHSTLEHSCARSGHVLESRKARQSEFAEDHQSVHDENGNLSRRATFEEPVTSRPRTGTRARPQSAYLPDQPWQLRAAKLEEENNALRTQVGQWKEYRRRQEHREPKIQKHINELTQKLADSQQSFENLQKSMLMGRDRFQPTQDSSFKDLMQELSLSVKSLSRKVKNDSPYAKVDLRDLLGNLILTENVEEEVWIGLRKNKELIESAVWRWIMHYFSASPFQVYGDTGLVALEAWRSLFGSPNDDIPVPSEMGERWKSLTATRLAEMKEEDEHQEREVLSKACKALLALLEPLSKPSIGTNAWIGLASKVVRAAANLADTMARQRCRLQFFCPLVSELRNQDVASLQRRKDIADASADSMGVPLFLVVPGLLKLGDGWAQNLEEATLLATAFLASEEVD